MKKLLLLLLFFVSTNSYSQAYIPMVEDSMIVVNEVPLFGSNAYNIYKYLGDTSINSLPYYKCYWGINRTDSSYSVTTGFTYHGAIREIGKKVYYVFKDSLSEKLLYDFSIPLNDTSLMYHRCFIDTTVETILIWIDSNDINFPGRRIYHYQNIFTPSVSRPVVEGFGNSFLNCDLEEQYTTSSRLCVIKKNNSSHNIPSSYSQCYQKMIASIDEKKINLSYLYPNPSKDIVNIGFRKGIVSSTKPVKLIIYNLKGQTQKSMSISSQKSEISIEFLPKGVYLFVLRSDQISTYHKVVVQ